MEKNPLVSIILNFYNEEDNLEECLDSIKDQTYTNFEIIAVDDGSTDDSSHVVKSYSKYMDIKMYKTPHVGIKKARKGGVKKSSGEIVLVVDADEILELDFMMEIVRTFDDKEVGAVGGILKSVGEGWVTDAYGALNEIFYKLRKNEEREVDWIQGGCSAYRRKALKDVGGLASEKVSADKDISWKMSDAGWKVILNEDAVAYHKDPQTLRSVMRREYNIGKREYWLLKEHKGRKGWKEWSRFYPLVGILILILIPFFTFLAYTLIAGLVLIFITSFILSTKYSNSRVSIRFSIWIVLTLINLSWNMGYISSLVKRL